MEVDLEVDVFSDDEFGSVLSDEELVLPSSDDESDVDEPNDLANNAWRQIKTGDRRNFRVEDFHEAHGPNHQLLDSASAYDYFSLFWGDDIWNFIVEETNRFVCI